MSLSWAVFRNYTGHAKEILGEVTDYPRFFLMPPSAIVEADSIGKNKVKLLAPDEHIDFEVEMVIRLGRNLKPEKMCVGIDTTNRTRQTLAKKEGWPWLEGKGFKGSGVLGTWTNWDSRPVEIGLIQNGQIKQHESTKKMVHSVEKLLLHLNNWYDITPGDYLWTGTPKGVGPMQLGDSIECWMNNEDGEKISSLFATCV